MLLHLDADLYNGTSIWGDLGKNSSNVAISGIKHTDTNIYPGSYFNFNGSGLKCSKKITFGKSATWEAWVRFDSLDTGNFFMCRAQQSYFGLHSNSVLFKNVINGETKIMFSDNILTDKTWYHLAFTAEYDAASDSTALKIYIDGEENKSTVATGAMLSAESDFWIGKGDAVGTEFSGQISIVRIYDRALSAEEVKKSFVGQHRELSIKYKSSFGDLKIKLERVYPSLDFNIIDLSGEITRTFQLGATGGSAPYEWSFNGGAFSSTDTYIISNAITSYSILVKDSIGLTSSKGYYTVNGFEGKTYVDGVFSY